VNSARLTKEDRAYLRHLVLLQLARLHKARKVQKKDPGAYARITKAIQEALDLAAKLE
jgi:hypothetical protein